MSSSSRHSLHQDLDRRDRLDARRLHGDPQHPDRQRLARRHPGRDRRRHRRRRLDLDLLPGGRDHRHPAHGWLARVFGVRRLPARQRRRCSSFFSVACAFAQNLEQMIVLRALQGFTGGVLIPMAFTIIITLLPQPKQPIGLAMFAHRRHLRAGDRPDDRRLSHRELGLAFIFYVNLVPGVADAGAAVVLARAQRRCSSACCARATGRASRPWRSASARCRPCSRRATRTTGSARPSSSSCWWSRPSRCRCSSGSSSPAAHPLLNLRLLLRRNFGFGILANFLLGVALYGSVFILPVYLARVQGYNAEQIGMVLAWTGLPQLLLIPLVPRLMKRFDARYVDRAVGFGLFAAQQLHERRDRPPTIAADQLLLAQHRPRDRPGAGPDAAVRARHGRHRAGERRLAPPPCST